MYMVCILWLWEFFFSSRRRHTRCALVTGVQTCALPIFLAISDTRIDEDTFAAGLDYERLEMQRDVAIRVGVVGAQPIATLDDLVLGRLDENRWICSERRKLEDPRDACCTDRPPLEGLIVVHTCRHSDAPRT